VQLPRGLRLAAMCLCAASWTGAARADCTATPARHVIKFYEYQGAQAGDGATTFAVFRKVVDEEVGRLNTPTAPDAHRPALSTEPAPGPAANYARGQLDPDTSGLILSGDPRLLELLDGRLQQHPTRNVYVVHSDIYLLAIPPAAPIQPISEDFFMDPDQYETARSVHLAATYFALSTDAGRRSCRSEQVAYLAKAQEILQDVHPRGAGVELLSQWVRTAQQALGLHE
jgi:hypothetical protein